ncbi:MAG: hypothetical protein RL701_5685 [Pseudomonadota bacterium]
MNRQTERGLSMLKDTNWEPLLAAVEEQLAADSPVAARAALEQLRACVGAEHVVVEYAHARVVWLEAGPEAAAPLLERVVARERLEPAQDSVARAGIYAEAHYDLAGIAQENGDKTRVVAHFMRVRELDASSDRALGVATSELLEHIERVASAVLEQLPPVFGERLGHVPVLIESRPSRSLVSEGFDPRALGLFEGPTDGVSDVPEPSRIVLYANNLLAEYPDEPELSEQIAVTVLHEVGHFFNLDEEQLEKLGLD